MSEIAMDLKFPITTSGDENYIEAFRPILAALAAEGWDVNIPSKVRSIAEVAFDAGFRDGLAQYR